MGGEGLLRWILVDGRRHPLLLVCIVLVRPVSSIVQGRVAVLVVDLDSRSVVNLTMVIVRLGLLLELRGHHVVIIALMVGLVHRCLLGMLTTMILQLGSVFVVLLRVGWVVSRLLAVALRGITVQVLVDDFITWVVVGE